MKMFFALWNRGRSIYQRISAGHARQRAIEELSHLSDWQLKDIGVERDKIPEIVDNLFDRARAVAAAGTANSPPQAAAGQSSDSVRGSPVTDAPL